MRRVLINGDTYAAPFDRLLRPLSPFERDGLRESVRLNGVIKPVVVYLSPAHGRAVIDGLNRAELSLELDPHAEVPVVSRGRITDDEARELALDLNIHRRHLSPDEQSALRERRVRRVAAARAAGHSLRTIAAAEGVSQEQIRRDLGEAGVTPVTPETVSGADGKQYPATRPRRVTKAAEARRLSERLVRLVAVMVREGWGVRIEALAATVGYPMTPPLPVAAAPPRRKRKKGAKPGPRPLPPTRWPALDAVCAVLRELAGGAASV